MTSFWAGRKVFITGATGFLGSWLTEALLKEKSEVIILERDVLPNSLLVINGIIGKVAIVKGNLENYHLIERCLNEYEIDTCFHLGAQPIVGTANRLPLSTFESNIRGTWNILEACRNSKLVTRVIIASSDKAYGSHKKLPYDEQTPLNGMHPYDASKSCADLLSQMYFKTYGLPVGITRCGNFYGGGDLNFSRLVPGTIMSVLRNEKPVIRSDGTYMRDYIYIKDVVDAYITLAENMDSSKAKGQAFNFGNNDPKSVIEIVNMILKLMGSNLKPEILSEAEFEIKNQYLLCKKAKDILGWQPKHGIASGLKETISWYKSFAKRK